MDRLYLHHAFVSTISCTIGRIIMGAFFLFFFVFDVTWRSGRFDLWYYTGFVNQLLYYRFYLFFHLFLFSFSLRYFFFFFVSYFCIVTRSVYTLCRFIERWTNIFCLVVVCDMSVTRRSNSVWTCRRVKVYCVKENLYRAERYRVCKYFETPVRNPASDWSFESWLRANISRENYVRLFVCLRK